MNRDGRTDAVVANTVGLEVWFGNGTGAFTSDVVVPVRNGIPAVQIADLNHDGCPDLVARTFDELGIVVNSAVGFRRASYIETTHTNFSGFGNGLAVADMNLHGTSTS